MVTSKKTNQALIASNIGSGVGLVASVVFLNKQKKALQERIKMLENEVANLKKDNEQITCASTATEPLFSWFGKPKQKIENETELRNFYENKISKNQQGYNQTINMLQNDINILKENFTKCDTQLKQCNEYVVKMQKQ